MTDEQQKMQDMLNAVVNQRNAAQNECVQLAAELAKAQRRIAELEQQPPLPLQDASLSNGRAEPAAH